MTWSRRGILRLPAVGLFYPFRAESPSEVALFGAQITTSVSLRAARAAGLSVARPISWAKALCDPSVTALAVSDPAYSTTRKIREALDGGKHLFIEHPPFESVPVYRAQGLVVHAGPPQFSAAPWTLARRLIHSEDFGLTFCRVADSQGMWLAAAQFALGDPEPAAVIRQSNGATVRYPGVVLNYRRLPPASPVGVWFHGARSTLAITRAGATVHSNSGPPHRWPTPDAAQIFLAHWRHVRARLEFPEPPFSNLEAYLRSAAIRTALRYPFPKYSTCT